MDNKILLAVYGTLRVGGWLHDSAMHKLSPIQLTRISGYDMYETDMAYPYITPGNGTVVIELYEVDETTYLDIERIEKNVGYDVAEVSTEDGPAKIFYFSRELHEQQHKITSGDWLQHEAERYRYGYSRDSGAWANNE